jgi:hypothetical protein
MIELVVALGILTAAVIPLAYSFIQEQHVCRIYYWRAVAMEKNLAPGKFVLSVSGRQLRLEWRPDSPRNGAPVVREAVGR